VTGVVGLRRKMHKRISTCVFCALFFVAVPVLDAQVAGRLSRIGYLSPLSSSRDATRREGFLRGLREHGYIEGRNVAIDYRFANGNLTRQDALAAELVRLNVDVLLAGGGTPTARALKKATHTIPIVMTNAAEPVANGLVKSLARPGGNVTGLTTLTQDLSGKRLELLKETVPRITQIAVLFNSTIPERLAELQETEAAAQMFHLQIQTLKVEGPNDFESAFKSAVDRRTHALIVLPDPLTNTQQDRIIQFATKHHLPSMFAQSEPVAVGGLMSYSPNYTEMFRRAAFYVDKILKGAKPADLPVEQPTKFELVINLKTAKQIGLTIPPNVLARADKVIK
jgi:putative tryptophan/tyrosine transport system substrate-binding protein